MSKEQAGQIFHLPNGDVYYKNKDRVYHKHNFGDYSGSPVACTKCGKPSYIGNTITPFVESYAVGEYIKDKAKEIVDLIKHWNFTGS
jgi:hypothetical protein